MRFRRNHKVLNDKPNAVSLAGVMFLFLFHLLTNSALLLTEGTPVVHLPDGSRARPEGFSHSVVVAMDHDARLFFQNQQIEHAKLRQELKTMADQADGKGLLLVLQAHRGVKYEKIMRFVALAESAGVEQTWLATQPGMFE